MLSIFHTKIKSTRVREESLRMGYKLKTDEPNSVSDEKHNHTEREENEPTQLLDTHLL